MICGHSFFAHIRLKAHREYSNSSSKWVAFKRIYDANKNNRLTPECVQQCIYDGCCSVYCTRTSFPYRHCTLSNPRQIFQRCWSSRRAQRIIKKYWVEYIFSSASSLSLNDKTFLILTGLSVRCTKLYIYFFYLL